MVSNTIEILLKSGLEILKKRDYNSPFLDLQLILMTLLKKDKIYLLTHSDEVVEEELVNKYYEMVNKRNAGFPLQYMLNKQEFMGLDFYVEEGVLIPRPDTEILVENIINTVNSKNKFKDKIINILDIGTGSGAISLSLAYYIKNSNVKAVDISDVAIKVTNINKNNFNLKNIDIIKGDLFGDLNISDNKFDIIVSNPPYIRKDVIEGLQTEVSVYEPRLALDGGITGLDYYEKINEISSRYLNEGGYIFLEIGHDQAESVRCIFSKNNMFSNIKVVKDLYNHDRVLIIN